MVTHTMRYFGLLIITCTVPWLSNCLDNNNVNENPKESKLSSFYNKVKDPAFECPPIGAKEENEIESPNIFENVDCDSPGARWDYNYKVRH